MHVAVLGAGYAGIALARKLERSLSDDVAITVVDERETHVVQHLIHRLVRYPSLQDGLTVPIEALLDRATHRRARVTDLDPDAGEVTLEDGMLSYDVGAVCLGARTADYDIPGVDEYATPLKRPRHAEAIRADFLDVCESGGRTVVVGAGLSGIQVAGELADLARQRGASEAVEVRLLEQRGTVAPAFPGNFQRAVAEELADRGVGVETGRTVEAVDADGLDLEGSEAVAYDQLVWTGGITGGTALGGQRPQVRADLRLGERTFAVGDAARVVDANGEPAPASAQTAVRQADVAAENVGRLLGYYRDGDDFRPHMARYRYDELGWLVSVGDGTVAQVGPSVLRGPAAKALKTTVGAGYLASVGAIERASDLVWEEVGSKPVPG
ncbi:MAG: NADH dehydrogenase FAD-containing subunit [Halobacteriales archaeon SW_9_67_25]|nr:MAG: NADH dehydrogenase FAD-containing subunit [Halobacteriales archaeon SW_9_67_25]